MLKQQENTLGLTPAWSEQVGEQGVSAYPITELASPRLCPVKRPRKCVTKPANPFNSLSAVLSLYFQKQSTVEDPS